MQKMTRTPNTPDRLHPFADEARRYLNFCSSGGVDHVVVIGRDLLMQALRCDASRPCSVGLARRPRGRQVRSGSRGQIALPARDQTRPASTLTTLVNACNLAKYT